MKTPRTSRPVASNLGLAVFLTFTLVLSGAAAQAAAAQAAGGKPAGGSSTAGTAAAPGTVASPQAATGAVPAAAASGADATAIQGGGMPTSFRGITLGMSMERVKQVLEADTDYFAYQGDADVSLLPSKNQTLIEVVGLSYVKRAFFQFYKNRLFTIILSLNPDRMDYYSMYRQLVAKYGEPPVLNPQAMSWTSETVQLSLERPLSVKYIDLTTFNTIQNASTAAKAADDIRRQDFLNEF
jgi:hypothetical protein